MIEITDIETVLQVLTFSCLGLYLIATAVEKKPHWFLSKALLRSRKIESDYERLTQSRRDMVVH